MILAIDPGASAGWAIFNTSGRLLICGLAKEKQAYATLPYVEVAGRPFDTLVIEQPHLGAGRATKADLLTLARRMQRLIDLVHANNVVEVTPVQWKGTVPKHITERRVLDALAAHGDIDPFDTCDVATSLRNNVIDAIGIGLWYVGPKKLGIRK